MSWGWSAGRVADAVGIIFWLCVHWGRDKRAPRGKKLIYIFIRSKSPSLSALKKKIIIKTAIQKGMYSHCRIQEYPKDLVQLSSPLLCCLPLAQNLSGISLEFMIAKKKKKISKFSLLWSAAPCALLSTWKTRKQHLTLKRGHVILGYLPAPGAAPSSLDRVISPIPTDWEHLGAPCRNQEPPPGTSPIPGVGFVLGVQRTALGSC